MSKIDLLESPEYKDKSSRTYLLLLGLWLHLNRRRRIQLSLLLLVMLASGCAELLSLGAVLPFLSVLSNPNWLWQYPQIQSLTATLGITQPSQLIFPASVVFAAAAVLAAAIRLFNAWLNGRLAAAVGSDLSCEAYRRTLYQPYSVHLQRNSADVITITTMEVDYTVTAVSSLLQLITSSFVAVGLFIGLLMIDATVALSAVALFGGAYAFVIIISRRELNTNSQRISRLTTQQVKTLQEGLGAIRDVLLAGSQLIYVKIYQPADRLRRILRAKNVFLAASPRYVLEALGIILISLLGGLLVLQRGSGSAVIPLLGAMALGAQRLLPSLQQIYSGWAVVNARNASISKLLFLLDQPLPKLSNRTDPIYLSDNIHFEDVHFRYGPDQPDVLEGLNLHIRSGERIGLIGTSGSGKTTTVDLLMGLLDPTSGRVCIDGTDLHDPSRPHFLSAWRASISHVPQSIYLADCSIAENIAFGVPLKDIDLDRVQKAAAIAQISTFIESSTDGYQTFVGERGLRLSGGQRQRIGIARAFYNHTRVLVLDEATSALDTATEKNLMDAIDNLSERVTVIIIAHRLTTLKNCDRILMLEGGKVVQSGTPNEVLPQFS